MESLATPLRAAPKAGPSAKRCPWCSRAVDLKSPWVTVTGGGIRVYCSEECRLAATSGVDVTSGPAGKPAPAPTAVPRRVRRVVGTLAFVAVVAVFGFLNAGTPEPLLPEKEAAAASVARVAPALVPLERFGPPWPPTESDWQRDLAEDAWIHPLGGPVRRMPVTDGRVFGAERPGDRPAECNSGHCGVDLGGEVWGEPVLAVHDGVVDRVNRGPNEKHGGVYVRLAHRGGTVFTQYFHLAAVPRWVVTGAQVQAGDVIGLLGDTGVQRSRAHLHFTISVKPSKNLEQYIDPEPLIALWPLWMPEGQFGRVGRVSPQQPPGVPRGANRKNKKKDRREPVAERVKAPEKQAPEKPPAPAFESAGADSPLLPTRQPTQAN